MNYESFVFEVCVSFHNRFVYEKCSMVLIRVYVSFTREMMRMKP